MSSIVPETCRAARALIGWSQEDLAREARIAVSTLRNYETKTISPRTGETIRLTRGNLLNVQRALEAAGVVFIPENGGGPGVRLAQPVPRKLAA